jgi:uroporphyrinogen decarboxylase
VALQGNLDPAELLGPAERIRRQVGAMIDAAGEGGYVVNLAQGVVPDIPPEGVEVFVDAVVNR